LKTTKLIAVISVIALITIVSSVSFVSALEQNEASVTTFMSDASKVPGQETSIRVVFTNNAGKDLSVYYVGIHLDWMEKDQLYGIDYSSTPKTVASGKDLILDILNYTVPSGTSYGTHSFYIGIDGKDQDGTPFSWVSNEGSIIVGTASSSQPATTPTPTATDQPQTFDMNLVIFIGLIAVAVVIIVVTALMMKKRGGSNAAKSDNNPTVPPAPEQKPEAGQDFNI
jgi:hypothetical protein